MLLFGNLLIELDTIDSTNEYLLRKSRERKCYEGEVVLAHFQDSGRGQRNALWESQPGQNLMFSIYLQPSFLSGNNYFLLSKAVAMSVFEEVKNICQNHEVEVKWPNDIYVNKKKIAGILIENQFKGTNLKQAIVGVGLNVNQTSFEIETATSLKLETSQSFDTKTLLERILTRLEKYYLKLRQGNSLVLELNYDNNLMHYNQLVKYKTSSGDFFYGTIKKVENNGYLVMQEGEELNRYAFKEIAFII